MLVPNDLEQVCTEGSSPHLVSLLLRCYLTSVSITHSFFGRIEKRVVGGGCLLVHPAPLMHPFFVDYLHVALGKNGVDECSGLAAKMKFSLVLDDIQKELKFSSIGNEAPAS